MKPKPKTRFKEPLVTSTTVYECGSPSEGFRLDLSHIFDIAVDAVIIRERDYKAMLKLIRKYEGRR